MSSTYVLARGNACLTCRKKKQRCDGEKPSCRSCIKTNKECIYNEPPKSRAQLLVDRIQELEVCSLILVVRQHLTPRLFIHRDDSSYLVLRLLIAKALALIPVARPVHKDPQNIVHLPIPESEVHHLKIVHLLSEEITHSAQFYAVNMVWNYNPAAPVTSVTQVEMTPRLRENLIQIFLQNRDKCYFDLHVGRFIASLSLPPTEPTAPHPALIDAILLVGCYFSRAPSLANYEIQFLSQALHQLSACFSETERLHDFVRASNLITFYYFCKGMYTEAYQQVVMSCHIAVSCGMHQIISSVWRPASPRDEVNHFLAPPRDSIELGERIHTFWQTYCFDKMVSMATSQPAHLIGGPGADPLLQVTTPWPKLLIDYETGNVSDMERPSVSSLFTTHTTSFGKKRETLASLRAQGLTLASRALHLINLPMANPHDVTMLDNAIQDLTSRLPGLRNGGERGEIATTPGQSPVNHRIAMIQTLAHVASLTLHQHGVDAIARHRCTVSTQQIISIIQEMEETDYPELFIGLGHLWYIAGRILITISQNAHGVVAEQNRQAAHVVILAMKRLSIMYPPLGFQLQQLQQALGN
ncbi:hypothetical protein FRB99_003709 [Tulasnella sp. 403]|nr:hypothetical protein FRB99_003709 [Tulasnella sp. 403]